MEPSNNRASIDADLSICHMCGEPAARWAQVLVRTVGVCRDHAAGPAAAINAIPADIDGEPDGYEEARAELGIGPGTLRLSVGLEDVDDLVEDIDLALKAAKR